MRMKNHFHIKGCAPTLVLKQRAGGTRKWPIGKGSRTEMDQNRDTSLVMITWIVFPLLAKYDKNKNDFLNK